MGSGRLIAIGDVHGCVHALDKVLEVILPVSDDRLVFYYSGHGWRTERDGVLRECLCLHDDFLFDDELVRASQDLPSGVLTVVIDACHSGGLSKPFFVEQGGAELHQIFDSFDVVVPETTGISAVRRRPRNSLRSIG